MGEVTSPLPPLIIRPSWPRIIFYFAFALAMAAYSIWVVITPWTISAPHPDFRSWRNEHFIMVLFAPIFIPFSIFLTSNFFSFIVQALTGSLGEITEKGIYARRWGFIIPWNEINSAKILYSRGIASTLIIQAHALLKPLQKTKPQIFWSVFGTMLDGRYTWGTVSLPYLIIKNRQDLIETLKHYLGTRMK